MGAPPQYCLRWNNHQANLLSAFDQLYNQQSFTDVSLICEDGVRIKAHRLVLAACSTFFSKLFHSTSFVSDVVVILKDVKASEMKLLLQYMYRGEVNVDQGRLKELLSVAEGLQIKGLIEDLSNYQTQPLPLVTSSTKLSPFINKFKDSNIREAKSPEIKTSCEMLSERINAVKNELISPILKSPTKSLFSSPPPISPFFKRSNSMPKSEDLKFHSYHNSYFPTFFSPDSNTFLRKSEESSQNQFFRDYLEKDLREKSKAFHHPTNINRRLSPNPFAQIPYVIPGAPPTSPLIRKGDIIPERLFPSAPLLQSAIRLPKPFRSDVTSSMSSPLLSIPSLLNSKPRSQVFNEDIKINRESSEKEESYDGMKQETELSDEDVKETAPDLLQNENLIDRQNGLLHSPEFSPYSLESSNRSHFSNFVSYVPAPKPEWKRYKQYSKSDLTSAIEAVKKGMTALQASRKFKVPSRTLYDKIKKMKVDVMPRRLPTRNRHPSLGPGTESLFSRPPSSMFSEDSFVSKICSDYYPDRPRSLDPVYPFYPLDNEQIKNREKDISPDSSTGSRVVETSARGSFSLVSPSAFAGDMPLDLTDNHTIPPRPEIPERA